MEKFRKSTYKNNLVPSLIFFVFLLQVTSCQNVEGQVDENATYTDNTFTVVLLGIAFDNIPATAQENILQRLSSTFEVYDKLEFVAPEELLDETVSEIDLRKWSQDPDESAIMEIADSLDVDHLYWGWLNNPREENREILLDGSLNRFDRDSERSYSMSVLVELSELNQKLDRFQIHLVDTIFPQDKQVEEKSRWPIYVVAAFALGGIAAFAISINRSDRGSVDSPNGNGNGEI